MAMTGGPANAGNEPDLKPDPQLAAAYRATADVLPPPQLDDAIRAAARREVGAGPRSAGARRWTLPLSLAAVLVLSVTLVTQMREQGVDRPDSVLLPQPLEPAPATPAAEDAKRGSDRSPEKAEFQAPARVRSATPPAPAASPESRPQSVTGAPAGALNSKASAGVAAEALEDRAVRRERAAPALRAAPAPAPVQAPAAGMAADAAPASAATGASPRAALWQDLDGMAPEQWRQRILEWRRAGRTADAEALAAEFRRRFPDQALPER